MCRMRQFLAVLSSFFHSSLLYTFSCHFSPPTDNSLPFSAASSIPLCYILFPATLLHQLTIPCCSQQLLPFLSVIYFSCHSSPPTDNSLLFSTASSIPLCYILFPATLLNQLTIPCRSQQLLPFLSVI